jgi:type II secretory pathway predicted ATPase ExeA
MLSDVMEHFGLLKDFQNDDYFETEHHKQIFQNIKVAIRQGRLIALTGIVGSGKTITLRRIYANLLEEGEVLVSKSLSIEKKRVTPKTLVTALFYDLSTEKVVKVPAQNEKRIRELQTILKQRKKPVALFVDEAHDLNGNTLRELKRLVEVIKDCGGSLSIVLAGHPKLKNDLNSAQNEEIGSRTTVFELNGVVASKREYIEWLLEDCSKPDTDIYSLATEEAIDLLSDRLLTPLQISHHLSLAFEEAFKVGEKPINEEIIKSVLTKDIDSLEPNLARQGYNVKALAESIHAQPKIIRAFLKGKLPPGQTYEIQAELQSAGIPI